jgi:hypothetical protein
MPELMIDFITSLDGYGAADGWPGLWGLGGPEYLGRLKDQPEAGYAVLMGATTYRLMPSAPAPASAGPTPPGSRVLPGQARLRPDGTGSTTATPMSPST